MGSSSQAPVGIGDDSLLSGISNPQPYRHDTMTPISSLFYMGAQAHDCISTHRMLFVILLMPFNQKKWVSLESTLCPAHNGQEGICSRSVYNLLMVKKMYFVRCIFHTRTCRRLIRLRVMTSWRACFLTLILLPNNWAAAKAHCRFSAYMQVMGVFGIVQSFLIYFQAKE